MPWVVLLLSRVTILVLLCYVSQCSIASLRAFDVNLIPGIRRLSPMHLALRTALSKCLKVMNMTSRLVDREAIFMNGQTSNRSRSNRRGIRMPHCCARDIILVGNLASRYGD